MNLLFFLTPKGKVAYIYDDFTLRQTLEKMEYHRYSAVPILTREGKYVGTITEGDLLWAIKNRYSLNFKEAENTPILEIPRRMDNLPVSADTETGLMNLLECQPVASGPVSASPSPTTGASSSA